MASRLKVRTPRGEFELPRRLPGDAEPTSEYLSVRHGLFHGDGFIQTSTILAPTALLRRVPFTVGLRRFQELDWALRCLELDGVGLVYAAQPLTIWHADENRPRVSFDVPWRQTVQWLHDIRPRVTRRAYGAIALSLVSSVAVSSGSPRVFVSLLWDARRHGRPGALDYLTHLQIWLISPGLRRTIRDKFLTRRRPTPATPATSATPVTPATPAATSATAAGAAAGLAGVTTARIPTQVRVSNAVDSRAAAQQSSVAL